MVTMMESIESYCSKNEISEEGKVELLEILNRALIEISEGILRTSQVKNVKSKESKSETSKRFKSKKAEEYAEEHGLSLEDFDITEISKKDVENKVRDITKSKKDPASSKNSKNNDANTSENNCSRASKIIKSKEKVICSGINKKGEACKSTGTIKPDGAKKKYCFRHAEDFRSFECDSDSSDDEQESCTPCDNQNNDDELVEEEFNKKEED